MSIIQQNSLFKIAESCLIDFNMHTLI